MRIARVLTRLNLGGPARQVLAGDPILRARGHEVRVLVGRPERGEGDLFDEALARGIDVRRVAGLARGLHPWRDLTARRALGRELAAFAPDLVHTHASKAGALGRAAAWRRTDAPLVHTFHGHVLEGYFPGPVSRRLIAHERRWARRTARIVAVSDATAGDLVRLGVCGRAQLRIVRPGVDLAPFLALPAVGEPRARAAAALRRSLGCGDEDVLAGLVGRLAPVKRPELAVRALGAAAAEGADRLHLVLVGDGERRAAVEAARAELAPAVRDRVHLFGAVDDMLPVHAALDVALCCSTTEGLPVALIEAAASARPAVAVDVGGVGELVGDGVTGRLLSADAGAAELGHALRELEADADARRRLGLAARAVARERHSPEALADGLEAVYGEALASGRGEGAA